MSRARRSNWSTIVSAAVLLSVSVCTPALAQGSPDTDTDASSDTVGEAREHFLRGVALYREGDFRAAIIEFERAYAAAPNYKVLYNIGQAHFELQDYAAAHIAFKRFLSEGGDEIKSAQRRKVEEEIRKLAGRVGKADIRVDVEGASIQIDDVECGRTPLAAPITVSAGRRKIVIQKQGYLPISRTIDVAGGDELKLEFTLAPLPASDPEPSHSLAQTRPQEPQPVPEVKPEGGMGTGFWVSLTATGVLAAGSGVMGLLAVNAQSDNDEKAEEFGTTRSELEDSKSKVENYALATDVLAGAALVAGGFTLYFAFDGDEPSPSTEVGLVPGGAVVRGSF